MEKLSPNVEIWAKNGVAALAFARVLLRERNRCRRLAPSLGASG